MSPLTYLGSALRWFGRKEHDTTSLHRYGLMQITEGAYSPRRRRRYHLGYLIRSGTCVTVQTNAAAHPAEIVAIRTTSESLYSMGLYVAMPFFC